MCPLYHFSFQNEQFSATNTTFKPIVCPDSYRQVMLVNIWYYWDHKIFSKYMTYYCVCKTFMFMSADAERQLWTLIDLFKANFYSRIFKSKFGCHNFKCIVFSWQRLYLWYKYALFTTILRWNTFKEATRSQSLVFYVKQCNGAEK